MSVTAFRASLRRQFDLDDEALALLTDWLLTMGLDEMIRRTVVQGVNEPGLLEVAEVGFKAEPAGYSHRHITVLRFVSVLRCPGAWAANRVA